MNKLSRCPHYPTCIGCCITSTDEPPAFKDAQNFFAERGVEPPLLRKGSSIHWRTRAKLAVRGSAQNPLIGLYREGTHQIADISQCIAHHPKINEVLAHVKEWIRAENITPYDESTHKGILRYVQLAVDRIQEKVQLVLVLNTPLSDVKRLYDPSLLHSLWINHNTRKDNVIFGKAWELVSGERYLWENYLGTEVAFLPQSFAQANPEQFSALLCSLKAKIAPETELVEYYAGVGVIGLVLVDQCRKVICSEIVADGKECFEASQDKLPVFHGERITYQTGSAAELLNRLQEGNCILVDPPRKGLDPKLVQALQTVGDKTLYYISCGFDSFKRDCDRLLENGWKLQEAETYLFFPGSSHIETLAVLKKGPGPFFP